MTKLLLTTINISMCENVYLFKNNSLKTKIEIKQTNFKKIFDTLNFVFDSKYKLFNKDNINNQIKLNKIFLYNLGNWFFRESFCFKIFSGAVNKILYISKIESIFSIISRRLLFFSYISLLGRGYRVTCKLFGVGYRVTCVKNNKIILKLGRSYRVIYFFPSDIRVFIFGKRKTKLKFFCSNLSKLMNFVFLFRHLRWPDSYKGKGIKLSKQKIKVKFREKFGSIHYKSKK